MCFVNGIFAGLLADDLTPFPDLRPMPKHTYTETKLIRDIATIMVKNPDEKEWTRSKLAAALKDTYPELSYRELMNQISAAIWRDKLCNKRFKSVRVSVWRLAGKG